jgi:hypothetical protein
MIYTPQVWNTVTGNWIGLGGSAETLYTIEGVARLNGSPVEADVFIYESVSGEFRAKVKSSEINGHYKIEDNLSETMRWGEKYFLLCNYGEGVRPLAHGPVTPAMTNVVVDPHWNKVVLLMGMQGAQGSTSFVDSKAGITFTPSGWVAISQAQSRFGISSAYFDGIDDYLSYTGLAAISFDLDFTLEMWLYLSSYTGGTQVLFTKDQSAGHNGHNFNIAGAGEVGLSLQSTTNGVNAIAIGSGGGYTIPLGVWTHLAFTKKGNTCRIFANGVKRVDGVTTLPVRAGQGVSTTIGRYVSTDPYSFKGWMQELRITCGVCRYVEDFAPPTAQFPRL